MSIVGAVHFGTPQTASATEGLVQETGLPEKLLNEVHSAYRFQGVTQAEAEV